MVGMLSKSSDLNLIWSSSNFSTLPLDWDLEHLIWISDLRYAIYCCWSTVIESKVTTAVYQKIFEQVMFLSADKLYGDDNFLFQQDLAPGHSARNHEYGNNIAYLYWPTHKRTAGKCLPPHWLFFNGKLKMRLWHDHVLFFYILLARNMNNIRDRNLFHWIRPIRHLMCHYENINQMCNIYYLYLILIPH